MPLIVKYAITAAMVVLVSEIARRFDRLGALVGALPLTTLLVLVWLYAEQAPVERISNHARYTFWYVLPTLPMFLAFPALLDRLGFWGAIAGSITLTVVCFVPLAYGARHFGVELL